MADFSLVQGLIVQTNSTCLHVLSMGKCICVSASVSLSLCFCFCFCVCVYAGVSSCIIVCVSFHVSAFVLMHVHIIECVYLDGFSTG